MINYVDYLKIPGVIAGVIIAFFFVAQIIGELLELKGKVVPEILKTRKYFARKKREREILSGLAQMPSVIDSIKQMPVMMADVTSFLNEVNEHYNKDNITKRDKWMEWVNNQATIYDSSFDKVEKKIDKIDGVILSLLIDIKRDTIINFASKVIDEKYPVTREQYNRVFKLYEEYEEIIKENRMTNGEVDIAIRIIRDSYKTHMKNRTFVEDIRGYNK
jgi:hypothetical protein